MEILRVDKNSAPYLAQAARLLTDELPFGWPTYADAADAVKKLLENPDYLMLGAVEENRVIGWAGLLPGYGKMLELHPLAVRRDWQRKGVGTALLCEIESAAKEKGGLTLLAGSGDEAPGGETSLANVDLYADLPGKLAAFAPGTHASAFYLKRGFQVVGVVPDAYGIGKPDIQMAKRLL